MTVHDPTRRLQPLARRAATAGIICGIAQTAGADGTGAPRIARVRSDSVSIAATIRDGIERSATF